MSGKPRRTRLYAYAWRQPDDPPAVPSVEQQFALIAEWADRHESGALRLKQFDGPLRENSAIITRGGLGRILSDIEGGTRPAVVAIIERPSYRLGPTTQVLDEIRAVGATVKILSVAEVDRLRSEPPSPEEPTSPRPGPAIEASPPRKTITREQQRRLAQAREQNVREGNKGAGPAPFGYQRDKQGKSLVPHPDEAPHVTFAFSEYLRTKSIVKVIAALAARGRTKTRGGRKWSAAGLAWILKNRSYIGFVTYGATQARGKHKPLVSMIVFNRVQMILRENAAKMHRTHVRSKLLTPSSS